MRTLYSTCVDWPKSRMGALETLISDAVDIDRDTFLRMVSRGHMRAIERALGYDRNLRMENDPHVRYRLDERSGVPFFVHSAIEHVFAHPGEVEGLQERSRRVTFLVRNPADLDVTDPLDPDCYSSRLEEVLDEASRHQGPVLVVDDGRFGEIYVSDRLAMRLIVDQRRDDGARMLSPVPTDGFETLTAEEIEKIVDNVADLRDPAEDMKEMTDDPTP